MIEVGITEAQARIDWLIEQVQKGEAVTITRYGKPVAELTVPTATRKRIVEAHLAEVDLGRIRPNTLIGVSFSRG